ncbi:putative cation-transporting ATPase [Neospora caninum Liverpool]|uniref:Putative cation-transporting ATPase n=1 Tax=Neospora caninum (strain Liverpool) TaxID=572307 RepID=F0VAF2_NEOCL|nr:putative cation-transporting ATPase [Neospora caninum Liverpool]CBZ50641.1 putative cation-transporting ATPase [Neospora caninum Liverpool]|eukprot:XP_003880674.1 putative cation-transporting ATPase [Neospora caninum Liverpool]
MSRPTSNLQEKGGSSGSTSADLRTRRFFLYRKKPWPLRYDVWPFALLVGACAVLVFNDLAYREDVLPVSPTSPRPPPESASTLGDAASSDTAADPREALEEDTRNPQPAERIPAEAGIPPSASSGASDPQYDEIDASTSSSTEAPKTIEELFPTLAWLFSSVYFLYCLLWAFLGGLLHLSTHWFVALDCLVGHTRTSSVDEATDVLVIPPGGKPLERRTLCPLIRRPDQAFFFYRKKKFMFVPATSSFEPLRFPKSQPLSEYLKWKGLEAAPQSSPQPLPPTSVKLASELQCAPVEKTLSPRWDPSEDISVQAVQAKYGLNDYDIPIPTFQELLKEHAVSPFFVFQMCCVFLWLIDEYWQYSLLTLVMLVLLECQMVKKRLKDFQQLRAMRIPPRPVHVFRSGSWVPIRSDFLLPGDVFAITGSSKPDAAVCPVDALLLQGSAVVNEATLTETQDAFAVCADGSITPGESIPQTKGKLVRTILYCHGRVTVASREAWLFLGLLLVLALCASAYVLREGIQNADRSRFKLFLSCSHIVMAVVPAEFPITLSLAVTMSLLLLFTQQIFCTEPFRVPYAGQVDVCAFDKTGTLTSDSMRVKGVYGVQTGGQEPKQSATAGGTDLGNAEEDTLVTQVLPFDTVAVMGACHALAVVDGHLLGDPLEKAAFSAVGWTLTSPDCVVSAPRPWPLPTSSTFQQDRISILRRFPFSSVLQRMTVVARVDGPRMPWHGACAASKSVQAFLGNPPKDRTPDAGYADFVASKGSPEMIKKLLKDVPSFYDALYTGFCMKGYRVLALAYKQVEPGASHAQRSDLEKNLSFAGFLVVTCPIKKGTKSDIDVVSRAGHRAIMITGDSPLTACQVAADVGIFREESASSRDASEKNAGAETESDAETHSVSRPILILKCGDRRRGASLPSGEAENAPPVADGLRQRRAPPTAPSALASSSPASALPPALEHFFWESRDGRQSIPLLAFLAATPSPGQDVSSASSRPRWTGLERLAEEFHLCLTGPVISALLDAFGAVSVSEHVEVLQPLLPFVGVFARMSPQQKELVLIALNASGLTTLMCGDGTNDVGALKAAHVGVSLLCQEASSTRGSCSRPERGDQEAKKGGAVGGGGALVPGSPHAASVSPLGGRPGVASKKELERRMAEMWEQLDDGPPLVRLGDASIASPFTFKGDSIRCVPLILRSGRATLVTVIMMYKLMALNSTITAFALSVLTLDGVKLGDLQTILENLLCTLLTLMISKTRPSVEMGSCRPIASIFHPLVFLSLALQAALHTYTLYSAWDLAKAFRAPDYTPNLDGHFEPNLVNSVVFLLIASMHASTFLSNYEGAPFMVPLVENRPLVVTLGFLIATLLTLVFELVPSLNETLSLVPFPNGAFKRQIVGLVFLDLGGAWLVAWILRRIGWAWAQRSARRARPL